MINNLNQANKIINQDADFDLIIADYQAKETEARLEFNLFHNKMKAQNIPVIPPPITIRSYSNICDFSQ